MLQRDLDRSIWRRPEYVLNVTLIGEPDELQIITDHRLDRSLLFSVPEREHFRERATAAFERSDNRSIFRTAGAVGLLADNAAALINGLRARLGLTLTVADAIDGVSIRCPDLHELLETETAITTAFDKLAEDVEHALAFATAREQVLVPENDPAPEGVQPAQWGNHHHWNRRH